jgi:hypothetical protein
MGVYSDEPDPPDYFAVVDTRDCVRYTDVSQAQWFIDRINAAFAGNETEARLDGTTVKWFGYYNLPLGDWLYGGQVSMSDEVLKASAFRPTFDTWPPE